MSKMQLIQIQCPACGAPIQHAPGRAIANCPFCENTLAMVYEDAKGRAVEFESTEFWYSPFKVTKQCFERVLLQWLIAGDYTPDDVLRHAMVRDHAGIYAPFYVFTGFYTATWTASAGFDRRETYVDTSRTFRDGKWVDKHETKTRTVTDWRSISGEVHGEFSIRCCASRQIPSGLFEFCEDAPSDVLASMEMEDDLQDYLVEALTVDTDTCFRLRGQPRLDKIIRQDVHNQIPGDRSRNERWSPQVRKLESAKVYLPFWLAIYTYGGRRFHFVLDGQDSFRSYGDRPVDEDRKRRISELHRTANTWGIIWLVIGIVGIILFAVPTLLALIIGLPGYLYLNSQASRQKEAILAQSRFIRQQALQAIQARGGLPLEDDPREFKL
jgi:hypothetical protein